MQDAVVGGKVDGESWMVHTKFQSRHGAEWHPEVAQFSHHAAAMVSLGSDVLFAQLFGLACLGESQVNAESRNPGQHVSSILRITGAVRNFSVHFVLGDGAHVEGEAAVAPEEPGRRRKEGLVDETKKCTVAAGTVKELERPKRCRPTVDYPILLVVKIPTGSGKTRHGVAGRSVIELEETDQLRGRALRETHFVVQLAWKFFHRWRLRRILVLERWRVGH
jgi:hypothetical protein